jgi:hypothetical protein
MDTGPNVSLPELIEQIRRLHPSLYRELASRYTEAILAIEQDGVTSFNDNTDIDVEEELWLLRADLVKRGLL